MLDKRRYTIKDIAEELGCPPEEVKRIADKNAVPHKYEPTWRGGGKVRSYSMKAAERIIEIYKGES